MREFIVETPLDKNSFTAFLNTLSRRAGVPRREGLVSCLGSSIRLSKRIYKYKVRTPFDRLAERIEKQTNTISIL